MPHALHNGPQEQVDVITHIRILDSVGYLPKANKEQCDASIVSIIFILLQFELISSA